MFLLSRPSDAQIRAFLNERESDSFSYAEVGATRYAPPAGYDIDHNRILLGSGGAVFDRAKNAIRQWKMFDVPGIELFYPDTPIGRGARSHLWLVISASIR